MGIGASVPPFHRCDGRTRHVEARRGRRTECTPPRLPRPLVAAGVPARHPSGPLGTLVRPANPAPTHCRINSHLSIFQFFQIIQNVIPHTAFELRCFSRKPAKRNFAVSAPGIVLIALVQAFGHVYVFDVRGQSQGREYCAREIVEILGVPVPALNMPFTSGRSRKCSVILTASLTYIKSLSCSPSLYSCL